MLKKNMKQIYLFLLFIVGTFASPEYHGSIRHWTAVDDDGKTNIALHIMEGSVKLVFSNNKTLSEILFDMKLYSPIKNGKCQNTAHTLNFTLLFDDQKYIRGAVMVDTDDDDDKIVMSYMYAKCGKTERRYPYATGIIEDRVTNLEGDARLCFVRREPFGAYIHDQSKNFMELKSMPNGFGCQVFLILPEYMQVEDIKLPIFDPVKLPNASYAGHDETFWWKSKSDTMLPTAVSFDPSQNVNINMANSEKKFPLYFRIGKQQPSPALNFKFGSHCEDSIFDIYFNGLDSPECKSTINLTRTGFEFTTKSLTTAIRDSTFSPIFVYDASTDGPGHIYVKVRSPLSIYSFQTCPEDKNFPADQFVIQIEHVTKIPECQKAEIWMYKSDVVNGFGVLIDRTKMDKTATYTTEKVILENENATIVTSTSETDTAGIGLWWILIGLILLVLVFAVIGISVYYILRRRKRNKVPKRKIRHVSKSAASDEVPLPPPTQSSPKPKNQKKKSLDLAVDDPSAKSNDQRKKKSIDEESESVKSKGSRKKTSVDESLKTNAKSIY